jgi:Ca-activated chloride channel homolog
MLLDAPENLLVLIVLPLLAWRQWRQRRQASVRYPSLALLPQTGRTWRQRLLAAPHGCRYLAFAALIVAFARPQIRSIRQRLEREGIAIAIVVDVSSSMDMQIRYGQNTATRMMVARQVVGEFVAGNGKDLEGRANDLIGVIAFARYANTVCPMTFGHQALVHMVRHLRTNDLPQEDGTAYGDAAVLAAARLKALESNPRNPEFKSKVIVLLTDGENNCGQHLPLQAAVLAAEWGIRIYTISLQEAPRLSVSTEDGADFLVPSAEDSSDRVLERMARMTGGIFRTAHDFDSLQAVYKEIDRLEKTSLTAVEYAHFGELYAPFALTALLLLLLEHLLAASLFRVAP